MKQFCAWFAEVMIRVCYVATPQENRKGTRSDPGNKSCPVDFSFHVKENPGVMEVVEGGFVPGANNLVMQDKLKEVLFPSPSSQLGCELQW